MKLNREKFLKTEFGSELKSTIEALDFHIERKSKVNQWENPDLFRALQEDINKLFAQWEVYKLAMKQFYGVECHFSRANEYFGVCITDESDWLFKVER